MKGNINSFTIPCLLFLSTVAFAQDQQETNSQLNLANLSQKVIEVVNDYKLRLPLPLELPQEILPFQKQHISKDVSSVVWYENSVPVLKLHYNPNGRPMCYFKPTEESYKVITFDYNNKGKLLSCSDYLLSQKNDSLIFLSSTGIEETKFYHNKKDRRLVELSLSDQGQKLIEIKYNKKKLIEEWSTISSQNITDQHSIEYKYDKNNRLKKIKESKITADGSQSKESKELKYYENGLVKQSKTKNQSSEYKYELAKLDSLLQVIVEVSSNKSFPIHRYYTFDKKENLIKQSLNFDTTIAHEKRYKITYANNSSAINPDLNELIIKTYYNLHEGIDSLSKAKTGDGYGRKVAISNLSKYNFMICNIDNRFIKDKHAYNSMIVPNIELTGIEEVFENDKAVYYKVFFNEQMEIYFPNTEQRSRQLIRQRGFFRGKEIIKDSQNPLRTIIKSEGEYLLYKKDKRTNKWSIT